MDIEVRLFSLLTLHVPAGTDGRSVSLTVPEGATVAYVIDQLGVPTGLAKLIFIDGIHGRHDSVLSDGNVLSIFPPIAGGS